MQPEADDKQVESLTTAGSSSEQVSLPLAQTVPSHQSDLVLVHRSQTVHEDPPEVIDIVT
jgi:DNA-directed RNA polymerase subunit F